MRLLFVCSRNRLRSPTAEEVFSTLPGVETASAGTSPDADNPISLDLVEWADAIFVMEDVHRKKLAESFGSVVRAKKMIVLGIRDKYSFMDPELVRLLRLKLARHLKAGRP
jgi:predicted protein tyrosine phosphatase